ncbi:MAG: RNA polymerase sigma factor [bacterium]
MPESEKSRPEGSDEGLDARFEDFYKAHFRHVSRSAGLVVGDSEEAFDITQEAFARTWLEWGRIMGWERPELFTFKVAGNLARNHLRRRRLWLRRLPQLSGRPESDSTGSAIETRFTVQEALQTLSARQRLAIVLCDGSGFGQDEVASILGIRPSTLRVHLARARARLRAVLTDRETGAPESSPGSG